MRIDNSGVNLSQAISQITNTGTSATSGGSKSSKSDSVGISSLAAQLSANPEKLAQLTQAYENAAYSVSSSQIASSLINDMLI